MILGGVFLSIFFAQRGFLLIGVGEEREEFFDKSDKSRKLGFSISLKEMIVEKDLDGKEYLLLFQEGEKISRKLAAEVGVSYPLEGLGYNLKVKQSRKDLSRESLLLELEGAGSQTNPFWISQGEEVNLFKDITLSYVIPIEAVKQIKSVAEIKKGGKSVSVQNIEIGKPIRYQGYAFYQEQVNLRDNRHTTLKVVKDFGMNMICAGNFIVWGGWVALFYLILNPNVKKKDGTAERVY